MRETVLSVPDNVDRIRELGYYYKIVHLLLRSLTGLSLCVLAHGLD
jgi:hypothetical protein